MLDYPGRRRLGQTDARRAQLPPWPRVRSAILSLLQDSGGTAPTIITFSLFNRTAARLRQGRPLRRAGRSRRRARKANEKELCSGEAGRLTVALQSAVRPNGIIRATRIALGAKVGAGEANGDILPSGDFTLDARPVTRRPVAVDAAALGPVARFEIGAIVIAGDHAFGFGRRLSPMPQRRRNGIQKRLERTNHRESLNQSARSPLHRFGRAYNC
ncbi:hypothetical protein CR492_08755 [Methylocella silvestris]|uniref:Uncharacterized protein n=1 Tax=Methylocella silvestris TaxID=199596 RepID=A0A2J7TI69_METSI|nr:hypothetical protein CR492_08755 [Methylocella silvestris]